MTKFKAFHSASLIGIEVTPIHIEVTFIPGPFLISIIGLQGTGTVGACRKRILSALYRHNFALPDGHYTINVAPADVKKRGAIFDLPILLSLLATTGRLTQDTIDLLEESVILGEISLDGEIKHVNGALPIALNIKDMNKKRIVVPLDNVSECRLLKSVEVIGLAHFMQVFDPRNLVPTVSDIAVKVPTHYDLDMSQVYGQEQAKRALQVAAAGMHHILFYGPPGSGKTMLAKRLPTIMSEMTEKERIEASTIYSVAGLLPTNTIIQKRPFRDPHHSISTVGLIGGGNPTPFPGEISLAHGGILFLDEFLEFTSRALEMMRQVLQEKKVNIKRADYFTSFPSDFILVAALNPCPCGYFGTTVGSCKCSFLQIKHYLSKMSGPLLDRIDMQIGLQPVKYDDISSTTNKGESSASIYDKVQAAVKIQHARNPRNTYNGSLEGHEIDKIAQLSPESEKFLKKVFDKLNISMRSYHKILKLSRTIADLDDSVSIELSHIKEALMYRSFDKITQKFEV